MNKAPLLLSLALLCAGCASTPTPRAAMVRQANREEVRAGTFLGSVQGSSVLSGIYRQAGFENARNQMLDRAAALGATHVVPDPEARPHYWTAAQFIRGEAYRLPR